MEIFRKIKQSIGKERSSGSHTFLNPYSYIKLRKTNYLDNIDFIHIDGIVMVIFCKLFFAKKISRVSMDMSSLAKDVFEEANSKSLKLFLLGSKEDEVQKTYHILKEAYPNVDFYYRNGYNVNVGELADVLKGINPNILIIGMGTPNQEIMAVKIKNSVNIDRIYTCGGFIHQTANGLNYYPPIINKLNLRSVYRIFKEKYVLKRVLLYYTTFPFIFAYDYFFKRQ